MDYGPYTPGEPPVFRPAEGSPESRQAEVVGRLRERYAEAQRYIADQPPDPSAHSQLEWILGARRDPGRENGPFDAGFCELVVLWLEDLALELERASIASLDSSSSGIEGRTADSRQETAARLRTATREFAVAFIGWRAEPVGQP